MDDKIELTPESVRGQSHVMTSEAEHVKQLGKRAGASVRRHGKGDFGKQLDNDLAACAGRLEQLGSADLEQTKVYVKRLDDTVKTFEQTEQVQLDTLAAVCAAVSEASGGQIPTSYRK